MSPVRLYLLFSILTFASFALLNGYAGLGVEIVEAPPTTAEASPESQEASPESQELQKGRRDASTDTSPLSDQRFNSGFFSPEVDAQIEQRLRASVKSIQRDIEAGNGQAVMSRFLEPLPTALFVFIPIIALLLKILYLGSGRHYVEHLIYVLHNHAFLFAVIIVTTSISQIVRVWPQSEDFISLGLLVAFLINRYDYYRDLLKNKFFESKVKTSLTLLLHITLFALVINQVLTVSISVLISLLWFIYVPFYIYRSMLVVYQRQRWATIISFALISTMYVALLVILLLSSAVLVGFTYN